MKKTTAFFAIIIIFCILSLPGCEKEQLEKDVNEIEGEIEKGNYGELILVLIYFILFVSIALVVIFILLIIIIFRLRTIKRYLRKIE